MYTILKEKGYNGNNNIWEAINWLQDCQIQVDLVTTWDKEKEDVITGKMVQFHIPPYKKIWNSSVMKNYEDAFTELVFKCKDYL